MDKITHEVRLKQWTSIIHECRNSGMTARAWCLENNVNEKQFYYWQRRVRKNTLESLVKADYQSHPSFVQLPIPAHSSENISSFTPDMVLRIGDTVLELSNSTSEELLLKVLKGISNAK